MTSPPRRRAFAEASVEDALVAEVITQIAAVDERDVVVVSADRMLRDRVEAAGASCRTPAWLPNQL